MIVNTDINGKPYAVIRRLIS